MLGFTVIRGHPGDVPQRQGDGGSAGLDPCPELKSGFRI